MPGRRWRSAPTTPTPSERFSGTKPLQPPRPETRRGGRTSRALGARPGAQNGVGNALQVSPCRPSRRLDRQAVVDRQHEMRERVGVGSGREVPSLDGDGSGAGRRTRESRGRSHEVRLIAENRRDLTEPSSSSRSVGEGRTRRAVEDQDGEMFGTNAVFSRRR